MGAGAWAMQLLQQQVECSVANVLSWHLCFARCHFSRSAVLVMIGSLRCERDRDGPECWYFVLNNVAVSRRISLTPRTTLTQNFWVNYSGFYTLGIVADRKYPHRELQCLLGINDAYVVKDCAEVRLKYSWTLSCSGAKETYSGNSDKILGGAYATNWMEIQFGGFEAKHWERCHLKITVVDGSPLLADANPKLRVLTELY